MGRPPKAKVRRPTMKSVYIRSGSRGSLHVIVDGAPRTLCGLRATSPAGVVTVHDRVTCPVCIGIIHLIRIGVVVLRHPDSEE